MGREGYGGGVARVEQVRSWVVLLATVVLTGCRSAGHLPPADLSTGGWRVRQGQAVWKNGGAELAGEVILAIRPGASSLQFIKTPLPLVSAQTEGTRWTVHFAADNRTISGRGVPPAELVWVHVAAALSGQVPREPIRFVSDATGNWEVRNSQTGETVSGFLSQ
ncbi:MAG: hypothetical protein L0Y58_18795 [Verrucomicrobia subdivision 3 bacterium]|nr:hypothetical protein [Limisphaerales bacterium]